MERNAPVLLNSFFFINGRFSRNLYFKDDAICFMQEIPLIYALKKVEVFQESAMFTVEGKAELEKGEYKLFFENLPEKIRKDSVRVKGVGEGKIINIEIDEETRLAGINEEIEALRKKIESDKNTETLYQRRLEDARNRKQKTLEAMNAFASEYPKYFSLGKIDVDTIAKLEAKLKDTLNEQTKEIFVMEVAIKELGDEIQKEQQALSKKISEEQSRLRTYYKIAVIIEAKSKSMFTISAKFLVNGAYWEPMYDVNISDEDVEIKLIANVHNTTDYDWKDIDLVISTASIQPVKIIKPEPLYMKEINYAYAPSYRAKKFAPMKKMEIQMSAGMPQQELDLSVAQSMDMPKAVPEPVMQSMQVDQAETYDASSNLGVQTFQIPTKTTILCDYKNPKPITLLSKKMSSKKKYFWSVKAPAQVLCYDKVKNEDLLLLPGTAKVYFDEEFIGETDLDLIAPYQEFDIGERVSYAVSVEKKLKNKVLDKAGALKGKKVVNYTYEIEIKNLAKINDTLELWDRVPHSSSEKIKIKLLNLSEEPKEKDLGVLKWEIDMEAIKDKKVISYSYEIQIEKDVNVYPPLP